MRPPSLSFRGAKRGNQAGIIECRAFLCSGVYCEIAAQPRNDKSGGFPTRRGAMTSRECLLPCHSEERRTWNLGEAVAISPMAFLRSGRYLPRRLRLLAMTRQGNTAVHQRPSTVELPVLGASVSALQAGNIQGVFYGMRPPSLSFRGAKRRGNLKQAFRIRRGFPVFRRTARLPRRLRSLAMTSQGNTAVHQRPSAVELPRTGRFSERLAGWQYSGHVFYGMRPPSLSFRGAKRRGISGRHYRIRRGFPVFRRVLRDCRGSCGASQ